MGIGFDWSDLFGSGVPPQPSAASNATNPSGALQPPAVAPDWRDRAEPDVGWGRAPTSAILGSSAASPWPGFVRIVSVPISAADVQDQVFLGPGDVERHLAPDGTYHDVFPNHPRPTWWDWTKEALSNLDPTFQQYQLSAYEAGNDLAAQGARERAAGEYLPSFPGWNPATWRAGGVLHGAAGHTGAFLPR
jgi:hypothetical protein